MDGLWIFHDSHDITYREPFGAVPCGETITLRLKMCSSIALSNIYLRLWRDGAGEKRMPMHPVMPDDGQMVYEVQFRSPGEPGLLWYYFIIETNHGKVYYYGSPDGLGGVGQLTGYPPHSYQVTVYKRDFTTPDWFKNSVMYQIFVDRFYNGNEDGSFMAYKDDCIFHDDWSETPCYKPDPKTGEIMCNDFFGGNLPGIIQKLPYLKELGISVLYLNPVFEAYSNHKYDVGNYKNIDPMFGDLRISRELCSKAKEMGISIILDGVFSHTGSDSVYFNKRAGILPGAYQSRESPYYSWYRFIRYPDKYDCWWGIHTLPT